jgi:hypothetical protein
MKCNVHVPGSITEKGGHLLRISLRSGKVVGRIAEKPILRDTHGSSASRAQPEVSLAVPAKRGDFMVREPVFFRKDPGMCGGGGVRFPREKAGRGSQLQVSCGILKNAGYDDALWGYIDRVDPEFARCVRHNPPKAISRSRPQPAFRVFENNIPKEVHPNPGLADIFENPAIAGAAVDGTKRSDPEISATIFKKRNDSCINRRLP